MGRKKRKGVELKPFCYYCDREFDDEKVLLLHQKAKHFKCTQCNRKLDTATGLVVHMLQVHKESLSKVPSARPDRDGPEIVIHGMSGVPTDVIVERQRKLLESRGLSKQAKSAHTVFGSGLFSGIGASALGFPQPGLPVGMPMVAGSPSAAPGLSAPATADFSTLLASMAAAQAGAGSASRPFSTFGLMAPPFNATAVPGALPGGGVGSLFGGVMPPAGATGGIGAFGGFPPTVGTVGVPGAGVPQIGGGPAISEEALSTITAQREAEKGIMAPPPTNGFLVYADDLISPEEKRSMLPKYSFRAPLIISPPTVAVG